MILTEWKKDSSTHLLLRAVAPWDSIFGTVHGFSYSNNTSDSGSAAMNPHPSAWWQRPKRRRRKHVVSVNGNSQRTFMDYGYKWYTAQSIVHSTQRYQCHPLPIIIFFSLSLSHTISTMETCSVCGRPSRLALVHNYYCHSSCCCCCCCSNYYCCCCCCRSSSGHLSSF